MTRQETIRLAHGAGGPAMRRLLRDTLLRDLPRIEGGVDAHAMDDGACLPFAGGWLVLTTDAHVVQPPFFPGGDIGALAVCGTVNDLAMMGATEVLGLSLGVILEDGFPLEQLERIQQSIAERSRLAQAPVVAGDTKVMGRGEVDGIVLHSTGLAWTQRIVRDCDVQPGDVFIVSGTIGDHGFAVLAARHELELIGGLRSDVAALNDLVASVLRQHGAAIHAMKDPTRGGVASALHEMAEKSGVEIEIDASALPISAPVRAAAELLGIDPLQVANEGKVVMAVAPDCAAEVLACVRQHSFGHEASIVGTARSGKTGRVIVATGFGRRLLQESDGENLPRIC